MILMYSKSSRNEAAVESPSETTLVMSYLDDTSVEDKVIHMGAHDSYQGTLLQRPVYVMLESYIVVFT